MATARLKNGLLSTSWVNEDKQQLTDDEVLFFISLTANEDAQLKDVFTINSAGILAEAYQGENINDAEFINVALEYNNEITSNEDFVLYQNRPNPFKEETVIAFSLSSATSVNLSLFDVAGRLVTQKQINAIKGYNEISLSANELTKGGVYYYQVATPLGIATRKMILIK